MRARQEVTKSNQIFAWWYVVESAVSFPGKLCLVIWLQGNEGAGHFRKGTLLLLGNTMVNDRGKQNPTSWFLKARQHLIVHECMLNYFGRVRLFGTLWTVACQDPLSLGFSRQEYWSGLPCSSPGDLPDPGIEPESPALQVYSLPTEPPGKPFNK